MDTTYEPGPRHASLIVREMNTQDCKPFESLGPEPPTETSNKVS